MATNPTEQQLKNRKIAAAGGTPPEPGFDSNAFIDQAANRLLQTSGIISSADTTLEKAITGVRTSQEASEERIESVFDREIEFKRGQFAQERTTGIENQRGFARNSSALRLLDEKTEKSLRDLEQRKQELILAGESAASERITELQIKEIEFQQNARQQLFTNLLSLSRFGLQAKQEERLERQQSFVESSAIASIALEFGVQVPEGASLESIVALVAPRADTRRKAELAKLIADTNRANAEAAKAIAGTKDTGFDSLTLNVLASGVLRGDVGILDLGLDANETATLLFFVNEQRDERTDTLIDEANRILSSGGNSDDFQAFAKGSATFFDEKEIQRITAITFTRENIKEQRQKRAAGKVKAITTAGAGTRFLTESALEKERKKLKGILTF